MTKTRAAWVAFAILLLIGGLNAGLSLKNSSSNHRLAVHNCDSIKQIARIEHRVVEGQAAQSKALLAKGFTFGIPKGELPKLVAQGQAIQRKFLAELDELGRTNCRS